MVSCARRDFCCLSSNRGYTYRSGYTFPIRVVNGTPSQPSGGIPACLASVDGKGCHLVSPSFGPDGIPPETAQVGDWSRCQALVDAAKKDDPYLACGDDFKKVYGWDGFDETDRESWCAAASLALDIRPDELRHHVDSAVLNTNFEKAAGRVGCSRTNFASKGSNFDAFGFDSRRTIQRRKCGPLPALRTNSSPSARNGDGAALLATNCDTSATTGSPFPANG